MNAAYINAKQEVSASFFCYCFSFFTIALHASK